MSSRALRLAAPMVALTAALQLAHGAFAAEPKPVVPMTGRAALNGYWEIDDSSRRANTGRAELTPAGQAIAKANADAQAARLARGQVVGLGTYICGIIGVPFIYSTSEPWALVITKDEVVQVAERPQMTPRHFYMDGRDWPDFSKLPYSSSGYSIGHWDGDALVVETRGMPDGGTPGGGLKGKNTTLTERFELTDGGKRMKVTFSFADPELVKTPATFSYMYDRNPPHTYAFGDFCDPHEDNGRTVQNPD